MIVKRITLDFFRNYLHLECAFSPATNVIYGENAQGKTNLLEAVAYLSTASSHRARYDRELIQMGEEAALVAEKRVLPPDTEPVEGLLNLLLSPPQSENLTIAITSGVTLRKWTLYNGLLTVDFSSGYGVLSGIDLTLADYSVVLTLTQLEGVEAVMITAEGEMLSFRDHQRLTAEEAWSALQSGMSEETAQDVS